MHDVTDVLAMGVMIMGLIVFVVVMTTVPTYLLWNWLMPQIFGLPQVTLLQAGGLVLLTNILTKASVSTNKK